MLYDYQYYPFHADEIKRVGDSVVGVVTQCIKAQNAMKCHPATLTNVCLKVNSKLGGKNSIVDPYERLVSYI